MKLNGIIGKGTGKLGSSVFAISGGEQVVREYNPVVSNPNTEAQIAQRAKLKLMSQLGAALAPALGFKKMGLVSARNQFVSKNIGLATFGEEKASVDLMSLDLTGSKISLPELANPTQSGTNLSVALSGAAAENIKRVAYYVYAIDEDGMLQYVASKIVSEAGEGRTFPTSIATGDGSFVIYAFGIIDNNAKATIRYEEYIADANRLDASLSVNALFSSGDYTLTVNKAVFFEV